MCSNDTYFDAIDNCDASKNLAVFPEMERRVVIRRAVNGDRGSLPGGENGKRLMVTEQGGDQLLYSSHYPCSLIKILVVMGI